MKQFNFPSRLCLSLFNFFYVGNAVIEISWSPFGGRIISVAWESCALS